MNLSGQQVQQKKKAQRARNTWMYLVAMRQFGPLRDQVKNGPMIQASEITSKIQRPIYNYMLSGTEVNNVSVDKVTHRWHSVSPKYFGLKSRLK